MILLLKYLKPVLAIISQQNYKSYRMNKNKKLISFFERNIIDSLINS